ncbi:hypothetical protein CONPUDRAFT_159018 [Coniophora puteana RWD-64-598 SS2]|uniref:Uncharacterized protein n=1 Tax=Coniophora puteana (strain RWD-64-598) TaxID=741705 RepID=A0A5M3MAA8_CONPW|nr:uncharacterized protein CONPUDRAFT_159018 [Coniophora puteana RWD-64-598 SS2]EIW75565.1 hypothetical protein CONPUDRAFT_159018 [Coniophora puteana RWD-64-598 SS2]
MARLQILASTTVPVFTFSDVRPFLLPVSLQLNTNVMRREVNPRGMTNAVFGVLDILMDNAPMPSAVGIPSLRYKCSLCDQHRHMLRLNESQMDHVPAVYSGGLAALVPLPCMSALAKRLEFPPGAPDSDSGARLGESRHISCLLLSTLICSRNLAARKELRLAASLAAALKNTACFATHLMQITRVMSRIDDGFRTSAPAATKSLRWWAVQGV